MSKLTNYLEHEIARNEGNLLSNMERLATNPELEMNWVAEEIWKASFQANYFKRWGGWLSRSENTDAQNADAILGEMTRDLSSWMPENSTCPIRVQANVWRFTALKRMVVNFERLAQELKD